jgi:hypothetical protein
MKNAYDYYLEYEDKNKFFTEKSVEWNLSIEEIKKLLILQRVNKRQNEYPPIGDQLDALWKGGDAATEMLARVQAVKAKYPKPEEI